MGQPERQAANLNQDAQALGRDLVRAVLVALRNCRTHGWSNEASVEAIESLTVIVNAIVTARGEFGLHVLGDFVYLDDNRLRVDSAGHGFLEAAIAELTTRGVGSVQFDHAITARHARTLVGLLNQHQAGDEETILLLNDQLEEADTPILLGPLREVNESASVEVEQVDKKERCKKVFFRALTVTRAVMASAHLGKRLELRHAKRVVQNMVDLMMDEEFTLLGMSTLKSHDNYTFYHSVNVCIYSLALAKRAGMNRTQLAELGVAALFHDLGKSKVPLDILRKPGKFAPEEWNVMKTHPEMGVKELVRMRGLSSLAFKSMLACFEHHMNYNQQPGGYPKLRQIYRPHVIGRIVAIADAFDAMTTKRVYMTKAIPRDKALSYLLAQAGTKFDPVLMRLFVNMIGVFPVGTPVRLTGGRIAVVTQVPEDPALCHRPVVCIISDPASIGIQREGEVVDLAQPLADGSWPDEILSSVDADALGLDVSKYFT